MADGLRRELNLFGAVSMIVGIVIGSGIFLGVNRVAAGAGSPSLIFLVWVVGGLLTLIGALTYAELGVMYPRAGGEYVFLRKGLGALPAFLSGWTAFTINLAGSAAALADIFAQQLNQLKPANFTPIFGEEVISIKVTGTALILFLALVNLFGLRLGARVQKSFTVLKMSLMVGLAIWCFTYVATGPRTDFLAFVAIPDTPVAGGFNLGALVSLSLVAALFAYDGWSNVVRVGSEIKDPSRNLPRAMFLGLGAVMLLYIALSWGYLNVLGLEGFARSDGTVASDAAGVLWPGTGTAVVATLILVSVLGSLNGITISGPRIYYAMARDRLFPATFARVNRHAVPSAAILAQALLSIAFLWMFNFNELTDNVVFISFLFYALAGIGLIVLRRRMPDAPRPYRVPGYPFVPILFVLASLTFVGYLAYDQFHDLGSGNLNRLVGLLVVLAGIPVFLYFHRILKRRARDHGEPDPGPIMGLPPRGHKDAAADEDR